MGPLEAITLAQRGQLPFVDAPRGPDPVMSTAKRLLSEAEAAGRRDYSWESAVSEAFTLTYGPKKTGTR